jgi:hypothetical protein
VRGQPQGGATQRRRLVVVRDAPRRWLVSIAFPLPFVSPFAFFVCRDGPCL